MISVLKKKNLKRPLRGEFSISLIVLTTIAWPVRLGKGDKSTIISLLIIAGLTSYFLKIVPTNQMVLIVNLNFLT